MALIKRNNIYYYEDPVTLKRTSLRTKCRKTAQKFKKELDGKWVRYKMGLISYDDYISRPQKITIDNVYAKYLKAELSIKKNKQYYTSKLAVFCKLYGNKIICDFSYEDACDYRAQLLKDNTNKTANNHLSEIKRMFQWCKNAKYIKDNVFDVRGYLPSTKATNQRKPIKLEFIERAIQLATTEVDRIYWTVLLITGLRTNDAGNLKPEDVKHGIFQQKTGAYREIFITKRLQDLGSSIYNVCPTKSSQRKSRENFQKIMKREFGLDTDLHSIRHTHFTMLVNHGFDRTQVGELTGTTSSVGTYAQTDFKKALKVIDELTANA